MKSEIRSAKEQQSVLQHETDVCLLTDGSLPRRSEQANRASQ